MSDPLIKIREVAADDSQFVIDLICTTLNPYYDGDHRAHAERILNAHLSGGEDLIGFFSKTQNMFIASIDEKPAGIIHLVGKKQQTYKISPLIVATDFQRKYGIGSKLLAYAKYYAKKYNARQLYCTVAETNVQAMDFFLGHGFVRSGVSDSQYKTGIREWMLYKPIDEVQDSTFDFQNISVTQFTDETSQVRKLLLEKLSKSFDGIDESWIDTIFDGYQRRTTGDVNSKYKLIFVAKDESQQVQGVAVATPKKGEPIKLMPFVAENPPAFHALLADTPNLLMKFGRKLYIHIVPTIDEVILLQRRGWSLDGLMPRGYHHNLITQQWSFDMRDIMIHLRVKQQFLDSIMSGKKTVEVRVAYDHMVSIKKGDTIRLIAKNNSIVVNIDEVLRFSSFEKLVDSVEPEKIAPGYDRSGVLNLLRAIYPEEKETLGVLAFVLKQGKKSSLSYL